MTEIDFDVAITTYRRPQMVLAAIRSCLTQGPRLRRVIVVDDDSRDTTEAGIRALGDPRVLLHVRAANGGIGAARREAMERCEAEWTITLDSDHELVPGALEVLAKSIEGAPPGVGIVGARHRFDSGSLSPNIVPPGSLDYRQRIVWASVPGSIGSDYLGAVSRRVRREVQWSSRRSGLVDTLFQLDVARVADAIYLPECLALQKSDGPEGDTRGRVAHLLDRRRKDAEDGVALCQEILDRHGDALRRWGPPLAARVLKAGAIYASLLRRRRVAVSWAIEAFLLGGRSLVSPGLVPACMAGQPVFSWAYRRSLIRGGATPD